jgi:hypothetical protein
LSCTAAVSEQAAWLPVKHINIDANPLGLLEEFPEEGDPVTWNPWLNNRYSHRRQPSPPQAFRLHDSDFPSWSLLYYFLAMIRIA